MASEAQVTAIRVDAFWFEIIKGNLISVYGNDSSSILRCLFYIEWDRERGTLPPVWESLKDLLLGDSNPAFFKNCADKLIEETKTDKDLNRRFGEVLRQIQNSIKEPKNDTLKFEMDNEITDLEIVIKEDILRESSLIEFKTFATGVIRIALASHIISKYPYLFSTEQLIGAISSSNAAITFVGLSAVLLTTEILLSIRNWWIGTESGARVLKHIIETTVVTGAGVAGGLAFGALGSIFAGPVGTVTGGFIGSIWAAGNTSLFMDYLTTHLFGIPKTAALENAYKFLGVKMTDSTEAINKAFRQLCLKYHPDKGGDPEEFMKLQMHMAVIKAARGDICC